MWNGGPQVREEEQDGPITFKPAPRPQGKVAHLLLADSVTRAVVYPKLEAPTGSTIKQVNTYSSQYDEKAHKPNRNVAEVIRQELAKKKYHTVILGAPTVDITNQDVSDGIMDENEAETIASSYAMQWLKRLSMLSSRAALPKSLCFTMCPGMITQGLIHMEPAPSWPDWPICTS